MFKGLPKNVVILGLVSFFNDLSSEMIYPIVPIFLTSVLHASIPIVGLIEGIAESTASITKFFFGLSSDYFQKRKFFVTGGYSLGAVSKILIAFAYAWPFVLFARFIDRLGKGMRTAARDSILLENSTSANKGYIFGFHRAFDSLGAVIGPLVALVFLQLFRENMRLTFLTAAVPAVIAVVLLVLFIKEKKPKVTLTRHPISWKELKAIDKRLSTFFLIVFIFSLGNSSDAFLLLYAKHLGLTTTLVVLVYVLFNLSQTIFATFLGRLADRIGAKQVFTVGLLLFAVVYLLFGFASMWWLWVLFPVYGIYLAATDGVSKAYVGQYIDTNHSATYFGAFYTLSAIGNLFASVIGGLLWYTISPNATFFYGSIMSGIAFLLLVMLRGSVYTRPVQAYK